VVAGVGLGLCLVAALCRGAVLGATPGTLLAGLPWLVAPLGASAVLVFGVPASPLAQPWAVLGGNTVSALVGIACVHALPESMLAAPLAGALAVAAMLALRCLHPPGGAAAVLAVMGAVADWRFAAFPVALNSLLLVAGGMAYNQATGRRYPHPQRDGTSAPAKDGPRFSEADLDAVLARYNQVLDLPRDDLRELLQAAELQAWGRQMQALRCADIMQPDPPTVGFATPLHEAWALLRARGVKVLPVVDRQRHVVGIVTRADFLRQIDLDAHAGLGQRLRTLLQPSGLSHGDKPEVVGQLMTRQVRVASADRPVADLLGLLAESGHRHVPVLGADRRLVGLIGQADLVRALVHVPRPGRADGADAPRN
jgi:CBS domain-containing membrane protein